MRVCEAVGLEPLPTTVAQAEVFIEALRLFDQRNNGPHGYRDLWKTYGWRDSLLHLRSKLRRVLTRFDDQGAAERDLDDAFDLLNYTTFFIRNVRDGNEGDVEV